MKNNLNIKSLNAEQLMTINGGEITTGTSASYDLFYLIGLGFRSFYEFVKGAAEFQASLPPNLKK